MIWTLSKMNKQQVTDIANNLLVEHDLEDWSFQFNSAKRRLGYCYYTGKIISISKHMLDLPDEKIKNTLLHEVAHALAGIDAGHSYCWKRVARSLGCDAKTASSTGMSVHRKWKWNCVDCEREGKSHRKFRKHICGRCRGKLRWKLNSI